LLSEQQTVSGQSSRTVSYTYDNDGNRLSLTYPGGAVVTNTFTARNQLLGLYVDGTPAMAKGTNGVNLTFNSNRVRNPPN